MQTDYSIRDVLSLVNARCSDKISRKGEMRVECPHRVSANGPHKFDVNVVCNYWKCYASCNDCNGKGGMLDLYALFTGVTDKREANDQIKGMLFGSSTGEELTIKKSKLSPRIIPKKQSDAAGPATLNKTLRTMLELLELRPEHKKNLHDRGLNDEYIKDGLYKSIPERSEISALVKKIESLGCCMKGVPGFYQKDEKWQINVYGKGFYIPYFDEFGNVTGMQMRFDDTYLNRTCKSKKEIKKHRYGWLSSTGCYNGCRAVNLYTLGIPGAMQKAHDTSCVYVTEGALKANVANALDPEHHAQVAIAGVYCYEAFEKLLDILKKIGVTKIVDAFDADRETNADVQQKINHLYTHAAEKGFEMKRFNWGNAYKGEDDFFLACRKEAELTLTKPNLPVAPPIVFSAGTKCKKMTVPPPIPLTVAKERK
ncbi:MAG: DUF3854 domain-containing protein [Ruthenibacterium sp.]